MKGLGLGVVVTGVMDLVLVFNAEWGQGCLLGMWEWVGG